MNASANIHYRRMSKFARGAKVASDWDAKEAMIPHIRRVDASQLTMMTKICM